MEGLNVSNEDMFYNSVGTTGGCILACALIPQIVLAHRRKSAEDISYMWQGIYITGLVTLMVYYAHFSLWPVFCPIAVECTCLVYLTCLKIYYENCADGSASAAAADSANQKSPLVGESTSINGVTASVGGARRSPKIGKYGAAGGGGGSSLSATDAAVPKV
ncbi:unnamed protein product [Scytosiphon promiscuus]